eukprot:359240-Chlamydomonas_euryale.AAC.4
MPGRRSPLPAPTRSDYLLELIVRDFQRFYLHWGASRLVRNEQQAVDLGVPGVVRDVTLATETRRSVKRRTTAQRQSPDPGCGAGACK